MNYPMLSDVGPMPVVETGKLRLRPYEAADIDGMAAMFGDREVTAFTFLGYRTRNETEVVLDEYMSFVRERGWGMMAMLDKATGQYLGEVGLFIAPMGTVALRYALARAGWNKGYATEASAAVIDDAFGRVGLTKIVAGVKPENGPSLRVVEKLGFTWESDVTTHGHSFGIFGLTAEAWRAGRVA
jgi:ribosomal-protein-alanine N-acetyltransferase